MPAAEVSIIPTWSPSGNGSGMPLPNPTWRPWSSSAPRLVITLSTLADAEACRKSWPSQRTNRKMKKLPVPGPKKPS